MLGAWSTDIEQDEQDHGFNGALLRKSVTISRIDCLWSMPVQYESLQSNYPESNQFTVY